MVGQNVLELFKGQCKMAVLEGVPGQYANEMRLKGFRKVVKDHPGIQVVASQPANWQRELAMTTMENMLQANPDIDLVWGVNDGMALGASKAIKDAGCSIVDTRMAVLGNECTFLLLVTGTWDAIVKVESSLPRLAERWGLDVATRRTELRDPAPDMMPYTVEVVAADRPGIVSDIAHFFTLRNISIEDIFTTTYRAPHTGTPMFSLHMTISVPTDNSIAALRGEFMDFCDQLNLDSVMEPSK